MSLSEKLQNYAIKLAEAIHQNNAILLLDFDGTVSPFHSDKMKAYAVEGVENILQTIEQQYPNTVLFVTGRPKNELDFLLARGNEHSSYIFNAICEHGCEIVIDGKSEFSYFDKMTENEKTLLSEMRQEASRLARDFYDANHLDKHNIQFRQIFENEKKCSFAFHWRVIEEHKDLTEEKKQDLIAELSDKYHKFFKKHLGESSTRNRSNDSEPFFDYQISVEVVAEVKPHKLRANKGLMSAMALQLPQYADKKTIVFAGDDFEQGGTDAYAAKFVNSLNGEKKGTVIQVQNGKQLDSYDEGTKPTYVISNPEEMALFITAVYLHLVQLEQLAKNTPGFRKK